MFYSVLYGFLFGVVSAPWLSPNLPYLLLSSFALLAFSLLQWLSFYSPTPSLLSLNSSRESKFQWIIGMIRLLAKATLAFTLGCCFNHWHIGNIAAGQLPETLNKVEVLLQFEVTSLPKIQARAVGFIAKIEHVVCETERCVNLPQLLPGAKVRLSWYRPTSKISAGDVLTAKVRLKRPRGFANSVGMDYHAWLLSQGVMATGYLTSVPEKIANHHNLAAWRSQFSQRVFGNSDDSINRFLVALLIGDKRGIRQPDWQILQKTGVLHLMAISGLHIGLIAALGFAIGRALSRCIGVVHSRANVLVFHALAPILSVISAACYAGLAGFSLPTVRALVACVCVNGFLLMGRKVSPLWVLGCCGVVVMMLQPLAPMSVGFWLSFGAVAALLYCIAGRRQGRWAWGRTQLALCVAMVPLLLAWGIGVSVISPLANAIAIPLVSCLVVPGLFVGAALTYIAPSAGDWVLTAVSSLFELMWMALTWASSQSALWWPEQPFSMSRLLTMGLGVLLVLAPPVLSSRLLGIFTLLAAVCLPVKQGYALKLTVLDVGQGLSVVAHTPKDAWVFDVGERYSPAFDVGKSIVAPYLRSQGFDEVNVMISHNDSDHSGGLEGLASQVKVKRLIAGEPVKTSSMVSTPCVAGQVWHSGDLTVEVLWPSKPHNSERQKGESGNHHSCVVLLTLSLPNKAIKILLPGDIGRQVESSLFDQWPQDVDVLVAAHHGSKTSSSTAFIKRVNPVQVVFSAGHLSRYNHPNQTVVKRFERIGATRWSTAADGAITWQWGVDGQLKVQARRHSHKRQWFE